MEDRDDPAALGREGGGADCDVSGAIIDRSVKREQAAGSWLDVAWAARQTEQTEVEVKDQAQGLDLLNLVSTSVMLED